MTETCQVTDCQNEFKHTQSKSMMVIKNFCPSKSIKKNGKKIYHANVHQKRMECLYSKQTTSPRINKDITWQKGQLTKKEKQSKIYTHLTEFENT